MNFEFLERPRRNVVRTVIVASIFIVVAIIYHKPTIVQDTLAHVGVELPWRDKDIHNAQSIASVYWAARAAGWDFAGTDGRQSLAETVKAIGKGHTVKDPESPYNGTYFGTPGISRFERKRALGYLSKGDDGSVNYNSL